MSVNLFSDAIFKISNLDKPNQDPFANSNFSSANIGSFEEQLEVIEKVTNEFSEYPKFKESLLDNLGNRAKEDLTEQLEKQETETQEKEEEKEEPFTYDNLGESSVPSKLSTFNLVV